MLTQQALSAIKDRNPENSDIQILLNEIQELNERQDTATRWIVDDVLPRMKEVWRYLLYQKRIPKQCLTLDIATARLEGHLMWLGLYRSR